MLIIGLGNHGEKYRFTRHNCGFLAAEELSSRWNLPIKQAGFRSLYGKGSWKGNTVFLLKPQTYMNLSGIAVREFTSFFKIPPEQVLVIHDDLDFPWGTVRLKTSGGHAGHRGLISLINELGTANFLRLRVGIGRPELRRYNVDEYVLQVFTPEQLQDLPETLSRVTEIVEGVLTFGAEAAMNRWHRE